MLMETMKEELQKGSLQRSVETQQTIIECQKENQKKMIEGQGEIIRKQEEDKNKIIANQIRSSNNQKIMLENQELLLQTQEDTRKSLQRIEEEQSLIAIKQEKERIERKEGQERLIQILEEGRNRKSEPIKEKVQSKMAQSHQDILETIKEFKFDYLDNEEKKRREREVMEDPVDMREEFRKIQSENMATMNRMLANISIDLITPIKSVEEGIERNLVEIPTNTRIIMEEVEMIKEEQKGIGQYKYYKMKKN
jgi:hypothetical protein